MTDSGLKVSRGGGGREGGGRSLIIDLLLFVKRNFSMLLGFGLNYKGGRDGRQECL